MRIKYWFFLLVCPVFLLFFQEGKSPAVVTISDANLPLAGRWEWAQKKASADRVSHFYIVYTIPRWMEEDSHIGSFHSHGFEHIADLEEILTGKRSEKLSSQTPGQLARNILNDKSNLKEQKKKIQKDLACIAEMESAGEGKWELRGMQFCTLDSQPDLKGYPIYFLSRVEISESIAHLDRLFSLSINDHLRNEIVAAVGLHGEEAPVLPFLEKALKPEFSEKVRKSAVFWVGEQENERALQVILQIIKKDSSMEVREAAVFALSRVDLPSALDSLIAVAKNEQELELRKKAVFWLSQKAADKACRVLEEIAGNDKEASVQEQAVFALSQHHQGISGLIRIAKTHPNRSVRKKAIFWLGQSGKPEALQTILDILGN